MNPTLISADLARRVLQTFQSRQTIIEKFIKQLVELESPSGDMEGSRAVVDALVEAASELTCVNSIERLAIKDFGQHLVIEAFHASDQSEQILLVGHTDTVHSRGSLFQMPWRREGNKLYGPGTFDMKANCAMAIAVLHALETLSVIPNCGVTIVLTCDEEVGSLK